MMTQSFISFCCFFALFWAYSPGVANAAVSERDWKSPGDGLLTFDDVNNREWLDLSETILDQFPGAKLEENYQSVLAELNPGGMFEGFSVAKSDDTTALAISTGIDVSSVDFDINHVATSRIINLLGITLLITQDRFASSGAIDEAEDFQGNPGRKAAVFSIDDRRGTGFNSIARFSTGVIGERLGRDNTGVMLYRVIPEPSSMFLVVQSVLLMLRINRCQRR